MPKDLLGDKPHCRTPGNGTKTKRVMPLSLLSGNKDSVLDPEYLGCIWDKLTKDE